MQKSHGSSQENLSGLAFYLKGNSKGKIVVVLELELVTLHVTGFVSSLPFMMFPVTGVAVVNISM